MGERMAAWFTDAATRLFGPVFALEATRVGRRMSTFVVRWTYLGILVAVVGLFYYSWQSDLSGRGVVDPRVLTRFAENFFWVYAVTQFLAVTALTPAFTAAVVTDEKERKTLDFLLVTDLSGREILFGKLAVRVGVLVTFVLAGLPVVSFMQFVGGIEPRLLLLSAGMTLATVLSLAALSVAASVLLARTRDAVILAYALPVAYLWMTPWGGTQRIDPPWLRAAADVYIAGNPFLAARQLSGSLGGEGVPPAAQWYLAFHAVVAVAGFVFAGFWLRGSAGTTGASNSWPRTRLGKVVAWVMGRRTTARRHPVVSDTPMTWREVYVEPGSGGGILRRFLVLGVLAAVIFPFLNIVADVFLIDSRGVPSGMMLREEIKVWVCACTCGLGGLMMLRATVRGASSVAGERDRDTWVSLLTTPLTVREILWGKWAGCVLGQRDLMLLLGAVWFVGVCSGSVNPGTVPLVAGFLAVYVTAFAWLGVSYSVPALNSRAAIGKALPVALFLGGGYWIVLGCCCAGLAIGSRGGGEGLAYLAAFIAGATPPVVLAGLPAVDSEFLRDLRGEGKGMFAAMALGAICGGVLWAALANLWYGNSRSAFADMHNRDVDEPPLSLVPRRRRELPRGAPPDSSDTGDSS